MVPGAACVDGSKSGVEYGTYRNGQFFPLTGGKTAPRIIIFRPGEAMRVVLKLSAHHTRL